MTMDIKERIAEFSAMATKCCSDSVTKDDTIEFECLACDPSFICEVLNELDCAKREPGEWINIKDMQPVRTEILFYWVVPKPIEECPLNTDGNPIYNSTGKPRRYECRYGQWSSLYKPTHWMPLPEPPKD